MESTQRPLSAINLAPTKANFSALDHVLLMNEIAGTTVSDSVGTPVLTPDNITFESDGSITFDTNGTTKALDSGEWANFGNKSILYLIFGSINSEQLNGITDLTINSRLLLNTITGVSSSRVHDDASGIFTSEGVTPGVGAFGLFMEPENVTGLKTIESLAGAALSTKTTGDTTGIGTINDIPAECVFTISNCKGIIVMSWDKPPSLKTLEIAVPWMYNEWVNKNNKVIFPGLKDYS